MRKRREEYLAVSSRRVSEAISANVVHCSMDHSIDHHSRRLARNHLLRKRLQISNSSSQCLYCILYVLFCTYVRREKGRGREGGEYHEVEL